VQKTLLSCLILLFFISTPQFSHAATPQIKAVHLLSSIGGNPPSDQPLYPQNRDRFYLYIAIETIDNGQTTWYCRVPEFTLKGKKFQDISNWDPRKQGELKIDWLKLEWNRKKKKHYNNCHPSWHWAAIDYHETPFKSGNHQLMKIRGDCRATDLLNKSDLGTMRFKATISLNGQKFSSPGIEKTWRGGLSDEILRVSRLGRDGNPLLKWARAFYNLPYIWGSAGTNDENHQSERFVGADCADLVVAAGRKAGYTNLSYCSTKTLKKYTETIAKVKLDPRSGRFIHVDNNKPLRWGRDFKTGDLAFGSRHVGFLSRDRGNRRWLDHSDRIIHTLFKEPVEESLHDSGSFAKRFEILRLRKDLKVSQKELQTSEQEEKRDAGNFNRSHRRSVFSRP
jgi:hypothetical protein